MFQFCNTISRNNATDENGHQRAVEDAEISTKSERHVCNIYLLLFRTLLHLQGELSELMNYISDFVFTFASS